MARTVLLSKGSSKASLAASALMDAAAGMLTPPGIIFSSMVVGKITS